MPTDKSLSRITITRINSGAEETIEDAVATEEPLEVRVGERSVAVVMRTPGHDRELAAGFLLTEGIVRRADDVLDMVYCDDAKPGRIDPNRLNVVLAATAAFDYARLTRHVFTASSCGICSKATIDAIRAQLPPIQRPLHPARSVIAGLPQRLRAAQPAYAETGGLHGAALCTAHGDVVVAREDIGRHNAVDKVVGHAFLAGSIPAGEHILFVSGRVSFEIMQKALAAGIPCVAAISAPTSAAIALAREAGQTLIGFVRAEANPAHARMNVYAGALS